MDMRWQAAADPVEPRQKKRLVELALNRRFAGRFVTVGKDLGKSHAGEGRFERSPADHGREKAKLRLMPFGMPGDGRLG